MQTSVQKKDSKPKPSENKANIDKILAQDFKKDLHTPKTDAKGLLSSNLHPPPKKTEKQSFTLAQIIQNSKNEHKASPGLSETHNSKFFMYGGNIVHSKSKDRLANIPVVQAKDFKQAHGLRTSELKPPKNQQPPLPERIAKRNTILFTKELTTPTDRSNSKGPPLPSNELIEQGSTYIQRPPKRRQTDIMENTKSHAQNYNRAITKEENKTIDQGYNLGMSDKIKSKGNINNTLIKPRDASPGTYYQKPENNIPSKLKPKPKEDILILYDHDLNFMKAEIQKLLTVPFIEEKLEEFDTSVPELSKNAFKLVKAKTIFVFLKFSPRVREKSLKILADLVMMKKTFIVKCIPANEDVDPFLTFEKLSLEEKKQIEHTFILTKENFDSYNLDPEHLSELGTFLNSKIA